MPDYKGYQIFKGDKPPIKKCMKDNPFVGSKCKCVSCTRKRNAGVSYGL